MTAQPDPSREPFEKFLLWLSPDRNLALKKHEEIMRRIGKYFVRKGILESEDMAGETRDRVIKIVNGSREYPNPDALFFSVASKVRQEYLRKPRPDPLPADHLLPIAEQDTEHKELLAQCLQRCLARLPDPERDLITRYYEGRGLDNVEARRQLMAEHGGESTLRVKAFRIRAKLRICINACMTESGKLN
jgi:DNA-directed RNA polymerase specialized sigma24 family protein